MRLLISSFARDTNSFTDSIIFPDVRIGPGVRLHRCIVDKNVIVPAWARIGLDNAADREDFTVSDEGIVVIEKGRDLSKR